MKTSTHRHVAVQKKSDEDTERKITLKYTERKLAEEAKAGIDVGDVEEVFDPKYVTPTNEDFM